MNISDSIKLKCHFFLNSANLLKPVLSDWNYPFEIREQHFINRTLCPSNCVFL